MNCQNLSRMSYIFLGDGKHLPLDTTKAGKGLIVMHKCVYLMHHTGAWHARPQILASPAGVELGPNIWLYLYVCAYVCVCSAFILFYFL